MNPGRLRCPADRTRPSGRNTAASDKHVGPVARPPRMRPNARGQAHLSRLSRCCRIACRRHRPRHGGGRTGEFAQPVKAAELFDPLTETWTTAWGRVIMRPRQGARSAARAVWRALSCGCRTIRAGGVAEWHRQGPAKPCTAVRFRSPPLSKATLGVLVGYPPKSPPPKSPPPKSPPPKSPPPKSPPPKSPESAPSKSPPPSPPPESPPSP
jgi:hypothetical protein